MPGSDLCLITGRTVTPAGTHGFTREHLLNLYNNHKHSQQAPLWHRRRFGMRPVLTSPWLKKKHRVVTMPPSQLPLNTTQRDKIRTDSESSASWTTESHSSRSRKGWRIPEVGSVAEEDTHHGAVEQEHAGDVEIRRVTQTCPQTETMEERKDAHCQDGNVRWSSPSNHRVPVFLVPVCCLHPLCVCETTIFVGGNSRLMSVLL